MAKSDKPSEQPPQEQPSAVPPELIPPGLTPAQQVVQAAPDVTAAVVSQNADGTSYCPPPGVHASKLGVIVHGHHVGRGWYVQNGTPVRALPSEIRKQISESDPKAFAPWAAPPPPVQI
jgi:hypothetical protein